MQWYDISTLWFGILGILSKIFCMQSSLSNGISERPNTLRWRHNDHAGVSNHQPHGCLLNRLFRRKSKKTSKLRVTGLCAGNSPGTGEFPAQMASYAENVSIWWRHHDMLRSHPLCWIICDHRKCIRNDLTQVLNAHCVGSQFNIFMVIAGGLVHICTSVTTKLAGQHTSGVFKIVLSPSQSTQFKIFSWSLPGVSCSSVVYRIVKSFSPVDSHDVLSFRYQYDPDLCSN